MALMERTHEYFKERRYRFSFLSTSPVSVAHSLYEKLGYADLFEYPSAYKARCAKKARLSNEKNPVKFDLDTIVGIYSLFVRERTGFVVRDKAFFRTLMKVEGINPRQCIVMDDGYAILSEDKTRTWIRELIALNQSEMHRLIGIIDDRSRGPVCDRAVLDGRLLEAYADCGFIVQRRGYSVMMCKPLVSDASFEGTYGDKFYMSRLDAF